MMGPPGSEHDQSRLQGVQRPGAGRCSRCRPVSFSRPMPRWHSAMTAAGLRQRGSNEVPGTDCRGGHGQGAGLVGIARRLRVSELRRRKQIPAGPGRARSGHGNGANRRTGAGSRKQGRRGVHSPAQQGRRHAALPVATGKLLRRVPATPIASGREPAASLSPDGTFSTWACLSLQSKWSVVQFIGKIVAVVSAGWYSEPGICPQYIRIPLACFSRAVLSGRKSICR